MKFWIWGGFAFFLVFVWYVYVAICVWTGRSRPGVSIRCPLRQELSLQLADLGKCHAPTPIMRVVSAHHYAQLCAKMLGPELRPTRLCSEHFIAEPEYCCPGFNEVYWSHGSDPGSLLHLSVCLRVNGCLLCLESTTSVHLRMNDDITTVLSLSAHDITASIPMGRRGLPGSYWQVLGQLLKYLWAK